MCDNAQDIVEIGMNVSESNLDKYGNLTLKANISLDKKNSFSISSANIIVKVLNAMLIC